MDRTRVFVVEDQPTLLRNLLKVLGSFPELEVVGSSQDGEQAVEELVQVRPQLVAQRHPGPDEILPSAHGHAQGEGLLRVAGQRPQPGPVGAQRPDPVVLRCPATRNPSSTRQVAVPLK